MVGKRVVGKRGYTHDNDDVDDDDHDGEDNCEYDDDIHCTGAE